MNNRLRRLIRSPYLRLAPITFGIPSDVIKSSNPNDTLPLLANRIVTLLTVIAYPLAFVGIVYSVYMLIVNSGNPDAMKTVRKNIGYIAGGIFLLIFALVIFNSFVRLFGS